MSGPLLEDRLELWRGRLNEPLPGAVLFVMEAAAEIDGFAYVMPQSDGRLLLGNLHARPGRTGSGIGGRLLAHALAWAAHEHPGSPFYLEVLRANTHAVAFYERHGALHTDERVCRFEQGFELPELEYTWLVTSPA